MKSICVIKYELQKEDVLLGKLVKLISPSSKNLTLISSNYVGPIEANNFITPSPNKNKDFMSRNKYLEILHIRKGIELFRLKPRPELVVFFTHTTTMAFPMLVARMINAKTIKIITGDVSTPIRENGHHQLFWSTYSNIIRRLTLMLSDRIVVESPSILSSINKYGTKRIPKNVASLFVDTDEFQYVTPYAERQNIVGCIGRLSKEKGIMNLMNAIPKVLSQNKDVKFTIIGDGPLKEEVKDFIQENSLSESVNFVGRVPYNQIPSFLNKFKLVVIPSFSEGLPNVLLEAMACGTPVIANKVGGIADVITDERSGFLLKNNLSETIANGIVKSFSFPELELISKTARETISKEYDYPSSLIKWKKLIRNMNKKPFLSEEQWLTHHKLRTIKFLVKRSK